jgi:DNA polymerase
MSAKSLLAAYLRQQKQIFMPDLILDRADLRNLLTNTPVKTPPKAAVLPPVKKSAAQITLDTAKPEVRAATTSATVASKDKLASLRKVDQLAITPRVKKEKVAPAATSESIGQSGSKREMMKRLFLEGCTVCHLSKSRTKMVFGAGSVDAPVMVIGEAPGEEEDRQGLPFVGAAGQLLTQMLAAIQCDRTKDIFITNVLKCHPPSNRNPESAEIQMCLPLLKRQIAIMKPKAILLLGRIAAHSLLGIADSIVKMRSKVFDYEGIPCMVIYHPAALLRNPEYKRPAWEDLQKFKELLIKTGAHDSLQ